MVVNAPILHPIAASAGHCLAWYVGVSIAVLREAHGTWQVVRRLPFDNAGALAGHLIDGTLTPFSDEDADRLLPVAPRLGGPSHASPESLAYPGSPQQVA